MAANQAEVDGLGLALPGHRDLHARARLAAHATDGVVDVAFVDDDVIDTQNDVARPESGSRRRRALDRGDDADLATLHVDLEADTGVIAGRADANLLVLFGIEELRVWIEIGHHATHGALDQGPVLHGLDVLLLDPLQHLGQQARLLPRQRLSHPLALGQYAAAERDGDTEQYADRQCQRASGFAGHPDSVRTQSPVPTISQCV